MAGLRSSVWRDPQHLGDLAHPPLDLAAADPRLAQRIGEVLADGQVRVEGEGLEDHGDPAPLDRVVGDVAAGELDPAGLQPLEAGDRPQRRRLAGGAGAEQADRTRPPRPRATARPAP